MRRITWALFAAALLAVTIAGPASAKVDRMPVSSISYPQGIVDWGTYSETGQVVHVRGVVWHLRGFGHEYLEGDNFVELDFQVNRVTSEGRGHGTFHIVSSLYPDSGWEGTLTNDYWDFDFDIMFGSSEGSIIGEGYGAFEGMQLRGTDTNDLELFVHNFEGEVKVLP